MVTQLLPVLGFLIALACLPFLIKWLRARGPQALRLEGTQSRVVSAVAVGPNQRVVTVEVGPLNARVWLVLGVSSSGIQCLHTAAVTSIPTDNVDTASAPENRA
jgi:flagellar protein FliO/FliZ